MRTAFSAFIVVAIAAAVSYGVFVYDPATAQDGAADMPRVITVSGMGEASGTPDQAHISLGVTTEARNARDALRANSQAMEQVFAQLEELGIPEENIQTSNFSINPQYAPYNSSAPQPRITGYQVTNNVSVLFEDLDDFGAGLDALVQSGANQVNGISFSISETDEMMTNARTAAVEDARAKAETLAAAAGVRLGAVLSISEGGGYTPPMPYMTMARGAADESFSVPIASGEQSVSVSVNMVFEIQ